VGCKVKREARRPGGRARINSLQFRGGHPKENRGQGKKPKRTEGIGKKKDTVSRFGGPPADRTFWHHPAAPGREDAERGTNRQKKTSPRSPENRVRPTKPRVGFVETFLYVS